MVPDQATSVPSARPESKLATVRRFFSGYKAADGYDGRSLTRGQKSAITRKYNELVRFQAANMQHAGDRWVRVRSSRPVVVSAIDKLGPPVSAYPKGMKAWRVVSLPPNVTNIEIDRRGKVVQVVKGADGFDGIRIVYEDFSPTELVTDPYGVAQRMLKMHPKANGFALRSGKYGWVFNAAVSYASREAIPEGFSHGERESLVADLLATVIEKQAYRYGGPVFDSIGEHDETAADVPGYEIRPDMPDTHYYAEWMTGLAAVYTPEGVSYSDYREYRRQVFAEKSQKTRQRRAAAQRSRRARMKGRL